MASAQLGVDHSNACPDEQGSPHQDNEPPLPHIVATANRAADCEVRAQQTTEDKIQYVARRISRGSPRILKWANIRPSMSVTFSLAVIRVWSSPLYMRHATIHEPVTTQASNSMVRLTWYRSWTQSPESTMVEHRLAKSPDR
eukprot:CAMPEP_0181255392 /NCGR_PEP_ID=MMETSP1096-20121128/49125_1 /TAXON_ID=156174 ORGANISM="Chrysochromulina ericina, Strain CCMP281" /NCGR_SAMPLE_ID=MMETSP1096 /ASSEMBLY_ACC=CAM_ASM_000453 /LENGTH=141 /DNA_ID=CAMNT_0023353517 /DNA_START=583 /DNA_END=1009 /DNA_ORIENTATION=+